MRLQLRTFIVAIGVLAAFTRVLAQGSFIAPNSKQSFPKEVSFSSDGKSYTLKATGASTLQQTQGEKSRNFFTLAHYMQNPPSGDTLGLFEAIMKSNSAKQITLNINMEMPAGRFGTRLGRYLQRAVSGTEMQKIQKSYDEMVGYFSGEVKENDRFTFRWLPDGKTILSVSGKPDKVIAEPVFGRMFWKAWFGDLSPLARKELVSFLAAR